MSDNQIRYGFLTDYIQMKSDISKTGVLRSDVTFGQVSYKSGVIIFARQLQIRFHFSMGQGQIRPHFILLTSSGGSDFWQVCSNSELTLIDELLIGFDF